MFTRVVQMPCPSLLTTIPETVIIFGGSASDFFGDSATTFGDSATIFGFSGVGCACAPSFCSAKPMTTTAASPAARDARNIAATSGIIEILLADWAACRVDGTKFDGN